MKLLKSSGIGKDVGTEDTAKERWVNFLGQFGYTPDQSFPDNMTKGTNRIAGDVEQNRKTTILNHVFNPNWQTYTYYDTETNIPLYTKTRGTVPSNDELVLWGGFQGMRDVIGNRIPTTNPKLTETRRETKDGYSSVKEIIRALDIIEDDKLSFTGQVPLFGWTTGKSLEEQQNFLETNHPEYLEYLIRNLHKPIEAEGILEELKVSKDKAEAIKLVEDLTHTKHQGLSDKIYSEHIQMDNNNWIIVVFTNENLKAKATKLGFVNLEKGDGDYFNVLLSQFDSKVSSYMKLALKQLQSKSAKLIGKTSEYYIRAPNGEQIGLDTTAKSAWTTSLKKKEGNNMFDEIRKKAAKSWFRIIKAPAYDEDSKKDKKLRDKDNDGNIKDRKFRPKFRQDTHIDPFTSKRKDRTGIAEERGYIQTDSHCCRKFKLLLTEYLEANHSRTLNMSYHENVKLNQKDSLKKWMEINLPCKKIEDAMSDVVEGEGEGTIDEETSLDLVFTSENGEPYEVVRILLNKRGIADKLAGKGLFVPERDWKLSDGKQSRWHQAPGRGLSFKMWWEECITGHVQNIQSEPVNPEADEFYEDVGIKGDEWRKLREEVLEMYTTAGGKMNGTSPDETYMEANHPGLFKIWRRISQTHDNSIAGMNENMKMQAKIWDYLDNMNEAKNERRARRGKRPRPNVDRKAERDKNSLQDYKLSDKTTGKNKKPRKFRGRWDDKNE
jgi:hypothetical protein